MDNSELFYAMALTCLKGISSRQKLELYRRTNDATVIYQNRKSIGDIVGEASPRLRDALGDWSQALRQADGEMEYISKHGIRGLTLSQAGYPMRLRECPDAPLVIYYKGNANLNAPKVITIVGSRECTQYGKDLVRHFIQDLGKSFPDLLIVGNLAQGAGITVHRRSIESRLRTVAVLPGGLDHVYPEGYAGMAEAMTLFGGLLTEHMSGTEILRHSFVSRNRIMAGLSDACIVVESGRKGSSLITAEMSMEYGRSVFAFPGPAGDRSSQGCNELIRDNVAGLISDAGDFARAMGWQDGIPDGRKRERSPLDSLLPSLSSEEAAVVGLLRERNDLQLGTLGVRTGLQTGRLLEILLHLEERRIVIPLSGGMYHLMGR